MLGDPYFAGTLGYMAIYSLPIFLFIYLPFMAILFFITKYRSANKVLIISSFIYLIFFLFSITNWM
jgi:glycerol-3-phosphate acyltransferase PlsY